MPSVPRRLLTVLAAGALAVALPLSLSGCDLVRSTVESATGGGVDIGGTSVPDDFPSEVPLFDGEVVYGASVGQDGSRVWNVTVKVPDQAAIDTISTQLTDAGFTASPEVGQDATGSTRGFAQGPYAVLVLVSQTDGESGWTANYTVTFAESSATPTPAA